MYMNLDLLNLQMNLLWTLKLKYHLNLHDAPWMEHGPWGGTNTGHPTMILTGMTHAHYQPALHPPPSDLGEF